MYTQHPLEERKEERLYLDAGEEDADFRPDLKLGLPGDGQLQTSAGVPDDEVVRRGRVERGPQGRVSSPVVAASRMTITDLAARSARSSMSSAHSILKGDHG